MVLLSQARMEAMLVVLVAAMLSAVVADQGVLGNPQRESRLGRHMSHELFVHGRVTPAEVQLRRKYHELRKAYGKLYCQTHDVGPTGGFCLKQGVAEGGNGSMDREVCSALATLFTNQTVLDFGCGWGQYGACLRSKEAGITWTGFDGSEGIEELTNGLVGWMDLSVPQWIGFKYDWVMSLEVAEHLPARFEDAFVDNLVRHASKGIVLSWAVPGQRGHYHVNCKSNEYVIEAMRVRGFKFENDTSISLRARVSSLSWLRNTLMVFKFDRQIT